ncbi:NADP-dependent 3-hydroxy acid dehydrogenase YdfG [Diaminobutyricimonas aerilata]|uniref:NADP-dependent 3-hydroxy acid dehydrogenase YdfG n=1 Tax=Diaminobutyricimonas aerilata TaxID=1162967 RepID=A0A2M9CNX7_9MICO|nr:SDR family oxidoreductase [Diaminobutyricimonas aerilata]PJJ73600.1 NADP-dependent 3-hydroxy acid dehydrogenase YdfG [Diaminobutyricimonas aerilata]
MGRLAGSDQSFANLHGRVAVVTGASGGIGRGTSRALLRAGASVVMIARDQAGLEAASEELGDQDRTLLVTADVTDRLQLARARDAVLETFGPPDLVVVGAGVMLGAPFEDAIPNDWVSMIDVNLHGLLFTAQTFADDLVQAGEDGRPSDLIFIGAIAGHVLYPNFSVFNAVSAAIAQLSRTLRLEYGRRGLRVHNIEPGYTTSSFGRHLSNDEAQRVWRETEESITSRVDSNDVGALVAMTAALPFGLNLAEMVVVPTEQG